MKKLFLIFTVIISQISSAQITKETGDFDALRVFDRINVTLIPSNTNKIEINGDRAEDVEIVNIQGKKINSIINHNTIQLDHLATGIYILQMKLENGTTINQKLIRK